MRKTRIGEEPMVQCNTWMSPDLVRRLEERAEQLSLSRSSYVRMVLEQALKRDARSTRKGG